MIRSEFRTTLGLLPDLPRAQNGNLLSRARRKFFASRRCRGVRHRLEFCSVEPNRSAQLADIKRQRLALPTSSAALAANIGCDLRHATPAMRTWPHAPRLRRSHLPPHILQKRLRGACSPQHRQGGSAGRRTSGSHTPSRSWSSAAPIVNRRMDTKAHSLLVWFQIVLSVCDYTLQEEFRNDLPRIFTQLDSTQPAAPRRE